MLLHANLPVYRKQIIKKNKAMKTLTNTLKLLLITVTFNTGSIFAQQKCAQGKRLPCLTGTERDQIQVTNNPHAKGLLIYNADNDCLEFWDGTQWIEIWLSHGNNHIDSTDYIGTNNFADLVIKTNSNEQMRISADGNVGIHTDDPQTALDVNGELTIKVRKLETEKDVNTKALYIDTKTGLVGLHPANMHTVAPVFYASSDEQILVNIQDKFNKKNTVVIPVKSDDAVINNLDVHFVSVGSETYFQVKDNGMYQIMSSMNAFYRSAAYNPRIYINVRVEKSSDNGASWNAITGIRPVLEIQWKPGQNIPIDLPVTVKKLKAGDLLRIVFERTADAGGTAQGDALADMDVISAFSTPAYVFSLTRL
jgi:hypothetical protein